MDSELLIALLVLWCGSTMALIIFLRMWFANDWAAFHPHSVDVENRHPAFLVVNSKTLCKKDCAIKSVSAFVAPRGSSSSKHFTALCMMISIAGMLGTTRWYFVQDATQVQFLLAFFGFGSLMLVAGFELDVAPERFLEDKQMITGWLIQKLKLDKQLPFRLGPHNKEFREFIRNSPEIYHLYEEDRYLYARQAQKIEMWSYEVVWQSMHIIGAVSFVMLVPAAIILNDMAEEKVAWITGFTFCVFCGMGYFTGNYVPVLRCCRGWILTWNPFLREPYFMLKLKRSVEAYIKAHSVKQAIANGHTKSSPQRTSPRSTRSRSYSNNLSNRKGGSKTRSPSNSTSTSGGPGVPTVVYKKGTKQHMDLYDESGVTAEMECLSSANLDDHIHSNGDSNGSEDHSNGRKNGALHCDHKIDHVGHTEHMYKAVRHISLPVDKAEAAEADRCLDSASLRYARSHPLEYLRILSYLMVMTELISLLTPVVAMGIQWITALCDGPPVLAIIELAYECFLCLRTGGIHCQLNAEHFTHCILKNRM